MSLSAIFGNAASELQSHTWSNPETQKLVDVLASILSSTAPIQLSDPLVLENNSAQAAIQVIGNADSRAVEITAPGGQQASMGIGLGNTGIMANALVPRPEYYIASQVLDAFFSLISSKGGTVTNTPGSLPDTSYPYNIQPASASGIVPDNTPNDVGGQTNQTISGYGRPTGYPVYGVPSPDIERQVSSGGGAGSGGGKPKYNSRLGGRNPSITGRSVGSGRPGQTHSYQAIADWSDVLGNASPSSRGLEFMVNGSRYYWPVSGVTGASGTQTIVTAVSCNGGTLSVTTATLNFTNGLYTGTT